MQLALRAIREACPDLPLITDVCLCQYTSHGACGVLDAAGDVDNDATLALLARAAVSHAAAGADVVAPSDMMDGRVAAIREALDDEGMTHAAILSYSSKFASAFYGPFRDAARLRARLRRPPRLPARPGERHARRCARRCSTPTRARTC